MKYIRELDSVRALAILTVIIVHWFPKSTLIYSVSRAVLAPSIFFTLSGFLITTLLLKDKEKIQAGKVSSKTAFKSYFLKRMLRIFPLYYLCILFVYFFRPNSEPLALEYFITFTSNFYINQIKSWPVLSHLWSLAVEEQFYLLWPFVIFLVKDNLILPVIFIFLCTGLLSQRILGVDEFTYIITTNNIDAIGLGALLAWYTYANSTEGLKRLYNILQITAIVSLVLLFIQHHVHTITLLNNQTYVALITIWLITYFIMRDDTGRYKMQWLWNAPFLIQIGKLSYPIYIFHFIIPYYTYDAFQELNELLHIPDFMRRNIYLWIAENFALLMGLAFIANALIERPLARLKSKI